MQSRTAQGSEQEGLQQQQHRTKISTVYLPPNPPQETRQQKCCDSRVTVNGRHHCNCGKNAVAEAKTRRKNSVVKV